MTLVRITLCRRVHCKAEMPVVRIGACRPRNMTVPRILLTALGIGYRLDEARRPLSAIDEH